MNLLLTIVPYVFLLIHTAFVPIKAIHFNRDDEEEPLIGRKESDQRNSVKKCNYKLNQLSYQGFKRNGHHRVSAR
uniref:Secreted protein n=1 Tax=Strongyloides papillosus TaxID=174720 RepID=A0A0N5BB20_STREA